LNPWLSLMAGFWLRRTGEYHKACCNSPSTSFRSTFVTIPYQGLLRPDSSSMYSLTATAFSFFPLALVAVSSNLSPQTLPHHDSAVIFSPTNSAIVPDSISAPSYVATSASPGCEYYCEIDVPQPLVLTWEYQTNHHTTITAATLVTIFDTRSNATRTTLIYNALPSGYTLPPTNTAGYQIYEFPVHNFGNATTTQTM
jgi:hypothetical protein